MKQRLNKRLVLVGAGGTGKTLLGRMLAQALDLPFIPSSTREIHQAQGTKSGYPGCLPEQKAIVQGLIMHAQLCRVANAPLGSVIDRSVVDVQAYSLLELSREAHPRAQLVLEAGEQAVAAQALLEDTYYFLVPPNIELEDDRFRELFPSLRHHLHYLIRGMLTDHNYPHSALQSSDPMLRIEEVIKAVIWRLHFHESEFHYDLDGLPEMVEAATQERALRAGAAC